VFDAVEARRVVESHACDVRVHVLLPGSKGPSGSDGPRLGESSFSIVDPGQPMAPLLDAAFARASLVRNRPWTLPAPDGATGGGVAASATVDPRIVEVPDEAAEEVGRSIVQAVDAHGSAGVALSASEVFCDYRRVHLENSLGLDLEREETNAYVEYVLLSRAGTASGGGEELEVYQSRRARRLTELALAQEVEDDVRSARDGARATLPATGVADVVLGGSAVEEIFDAFVAHASGAAQFEGWSRFVDGRSIVAGVDEASGGTEGDRLTLASDATIAGGLGSYAFDDVGIAGRRVVIVDDGVFRARACDQRHACWLGLPATGAWGNTVVASGPSSERDLLEPGGRPLYHLLRFSQLSPHATSGAFSGEIRFGYRVDPDGSSHPIRGGSLSGNVFDAFRRARFSSERVVRGRLHGPRAVRLDAVQMTGATSR
jgi:predicted Zn-dependent protease